MGELIVQTVHPFLGLTAQRSDFTRTVGAAIRQMASPLHIIHENSRAYWCRDHTFISSMSFATTSDNPTARKNAVILTRVKEDQMWDRMQAMFDKPSRARIARSFNLHPEVLTFADLESNHPAITDAHAIFGTWGFPVLTPDQIKACKALEIIFYSAGSIKKFGRPFLEAGIPICTAKWANARVVADTCAAQITLSAKQFFARSRAYASPEVRPALEAASYKIAALNGSKLALIGCGVIAREIIHRLRGLRLEIHVVDPYLKPEDADALNVTLVSLEDAFANCDIISNHLPDLPELTGLIGEGHFASMRPFATFINTGRGAQIVEGDLIRVFSERTDLTALLDVTEPEPPAKDSALYNLPNVILTPHLAGCIGAEFNFLLEEVIESSERWLKGEKLTNVESLELLDISA